MQLPGKTLNKRQGGDKQQIWIVKCLKNRKEQGLLLSQSNQEL